MNKRIITCFLVLGTLLSCHPGRQQPFTAPQYADMTLVGWHHRAPMNWTAARMAPHVSFTDESGEEHWLFQSFLFIEAQDVSRGRIFSVAPSGHSADKVSWEALLDRWLGPEGDVKALDEAVEAARSRMGDPPFRQAVILTVPDPVMLEYFSDKQSSTTYWGTLDGRQLDFADVRDQIRAVEWYVAEARSRFQALHLKNLDLGGFYVLSEDLPNAFGETPAERLNIKYKRWETILPALSEYVHAGRQGLYWIPYHMAPGFRNWKELGIDMAYMQPNYYWDLRQKGRHPFGDTLDAIRDYGMGMELEFEYSMVADVMKTEKTGPDGDGAPTFTAEDVPALREMFRDYLRRFKEAGFYGKRPFALYSGSDALHQLAVSSDPEDRAMYLELCRFVTGNPARQPGFTEGVTVADSLTVVTVREDGSLGALTKRTTGWNYAGGRGLWRLYYNNADEKEIEVSAPDQFPTVIRIPEENAVCIRYDGLLSRGRKLDVRLELKVTLEGGQVRFAATLVNNEPGIIIREFQYPLVGHLCLPQDFKLLTTHTGGQVFDDPVRTVADIPTRALYMTPAQKFRQYDLQYPRHAASNCFAFFGPEEGLYFGSHDPSFQQTWHGLRAYPDEGSTGLQTGDFKHLEAGFYRYPNVCCGQGWSNDASVIVPYDGDWTRTSSIYRTWADTWWDKREAPQWVREMTGWQRIIFKHQYGEYLRSYEDLPGRIFDAGKSVGCDAVLAFGWWKEGMDNGYPNYSDDDSQGGAAAWKDAIARYRARGGHLMLYFNGRLIDTESRFYRSGAGQLVSNHDNTGREFTEHYKFTGEGTTLGYYDARTFVIADMSKRSWRDQLIGWADRAMDYGANSVFYDQLGVAEEFPDWDLSGEYPVPDIFTGRYKAETLKEIRDHIRSRDPEFALGTEWLSDCTAQYCDFTHIVEFTTLPESFPDWFRYTFPEVIWSDRCVRDDNDVPRRVGNTLLRGLRNDIEVFRCRGLIDETPVYRAYLAGVNAIRHAFPGQLLTGRFAYMDDISCSNPRIEAREYCGEGKIAVVAALQREGKESARILVPGYRLTDYRCLGDARVSRTGNIRLGTYGLAVLLFEPEK